MINTHSSVLWFLDDKSIVCGRGRGYDLYPGNRVFRSIIQQHSAEYLKEGISRKEKSDILQRVSSILQKHNMKFVKRAQEGWFVLDEHEVNVKISHALRDLKPLRCKHENRKNKREERAAARQTARTRESSITDASIASSESDLDDSSGESMDWTPLDIHTIIPEQNLSDAAAIILGDDDYRKRESLPTNFELDKGELG